ncbi:hypothetical protein GLOIN_2v1474055 [Rhizophagus irregularis DAOM 181602=DAOM 197198]|uniref:Uncharacterized protein n=1 Tax=Rhizophagus irregularis (strain DAOM 181602 / DAOM 197198 / MUCL 43194) TaxID=747089 RepID=A0A2P4QHJ7_RHIID|nr:hypothetical protein GLOIN_2v1474055 [Rhizophagus irregularis DAOM 181602=DAOM 197198]POG77123.1 hypothetical protein GLOIN_2v1474055 [Rhizophagus irregularis DAOM 181602=DAOM 197198]|eukprot:XP_025183989.1 hypothetical protein GLOIN_2v1474055 [Rhizophagus irregularis DAOM 181602=DAOM 197198]
MVDQEITSMERANSDSGGTKDDIVHRRFVLRLGRVPPVPGRLRNTWKIVIFISTKNQIYIRRYNFIFAKTKEHSICMHILKPKRILDGRLQKVGKKEGNKRDVVDDDSKDTWLYAFVFSQMVIAKCIIFIFGDVQQGIEFILKKIY